MDNEEIEEIFNIIKNAHQKYADWWLPIDVVNGSFMAPMSMHVFCENLLLFNNEWWDRWIGDTIPNDKKIAFKRKVLKLIIMHHKDVLNLNRKTI